MKKYKLLKDLPGHKAGEILTYEECIYGPENYPDFFELVKEWPKSWEELNIKSGFNILNDGGIFYTDNPIYTNALYPTEVHAKSALAFAQLSQLAKAINGDWIPDWSDKNFKYTVLAGNCNLGIDCFLQTRHNIIFHSKEAADFSLEHHRELWEQYWML